MSRYLSALLAPIQRFAGERKNISAEAERMLDVHGLRAYDEPRDFAWQFRKSGRRPDLERYLLRVAANIAFKMGRLIGENAAERYVRDRSD